MWIFRVLRSVAQLYTLALILDYALVRFSVPQNKWILFLHEICAPGIKVGKSVASKLFKNAANPSNDVGHITAIVFFFLVSVVCGFFC